MRHIFFVVFALVIWQLSGCTTSELGRASSGGAVYEYSKTISQDGAKTCTARATSSREVMGATIKISEDCAFETSVDEAVSPYAVIDKALELIPKN